MALVVGSPAAATAVIAAAAIGARPLGSLDRLDQAELPPAPSPRVTETSERGEAPDR